MLANQIGIAGVAMGTLMVGFQGFGDALDAVNKARLDPTVENIAAAEQALQQIPPSAREAVTTVANLRDEFKQLQTAAADGFFPGMVDGLGALVDGRLADGERILAAMGRTLGSIARDGAESLASDRWDSFFDMLATEGPTTLRGLTDALGNLAHAGAATWEAFTPLNRDFTDWLVDATAKIDQAASGLKGSAGMDAFIDYVRTAGPQVAETLGAIATAVLKIGVAAAPLGGPVLAAIEGIADATSAIAGSDAGTALITLAAGYVAVSRAMRGVEAVKGKFGLGATAAETNAQVAGLQKQTSALKSLPSAYREAKTAQTSLVAAQREARVVTGQYVGQLRAANEATARGVPQSAAAQARLADSLGKVEMANYGVARAEERSRAATSARNAALRQTAASAGKAAALAGGLAVVTSGAADKMGLANTATLAMAGALAGPWGAAVGGGVGLAMDLAQANDSLETSMQNVNSAARSGDLRTLRTEAANVRKELADVSDVTGFGDFFSDLGKGIAGVAGEGTWGEAFKGYRADAAQATSEAERLERAITAVGRAQGTIKGDASLAELEASAAKATPAMQALGYTWNDLKRMDGASLRNASQDMAEWSRNADLATNDTNEFTQALNRMDAVLSKREAMRNYEAAFDAANAAIKENGRTLDKNTPKGRANAAALDQLASSAANTAAGMKDVEKRRDFLAGASKQVLETGRAMGMTRVAAIRYAASLGLIPRQRATKLILDARQAELKAKAVQRLVDRYGMTRAQARALLNDAASGKIKNVQQLVNKYGMSRKTAQALLNDLASGKIAAIQGRLNGLRDKTVTVTTIQRTVNKVTRQFQNSLPGFAGGGTIPGQRFPYGDKVLLHGAPGEEVITNRHGEADFFRRELKAINSGNAELLRKIVLARGYKEGGTVTRLGAPTMFAQPSVSSSSTTRVVDRIPDRLVLNVPGLGEVIASVARQEAGAVYSAQNAAQGRWDDVD